MSARLFWSGLSLTIFLSSSATRVCTSLFSSLAIWSLCVLKPVKRSITSGLFHLLFCLFAVIPSFSLLNVTLLERASLDTFYEIGSFVSGFLFSLSWTDIIYLSVYFLSLSPPWTITYAQRVDIVFHSLIYLSPNNSVLRYLEGNQFLFNFITTLKNCVAVILEFYYIWSFFCLSIDCFVNAFSEILIVFLFVCYFYFCVYVCLDHFNWN